MGAYKYASIFPMALCNKKRRDHRKKPWRKKSMKIRNCFCKYAIDDNQVAYIHNWPKSLSRALMLLNSSTVRAHSYMLLNSSTTRAQGYMFFFFFQVLVRILQKNVLFTMRGERDSSIFPKCKITVCTVKIGMGTGLLLWDLKVTCCSTLALWELIVTCCSTLSLWELKVTCCLTLALWELKVTCCSTLALWDLKVT